MKIRVLSALGRCFKLIDHEGRCGYQLACLDMGFAGNDDQRKGLLIFLTTLLYNDQNYTREKPICKQQFFPKTLRLQIS